MRVLRTRDDLAAALDDTASGDVALVPTMGALHEGHLSLVDRARERADRVVVSIFVNPLQFGPGEDFDAYPRDLTRDTEVLRPRGADLVFAPERAEMYPAGEPGVTVSAGRMGRLLCGAFRPGHFDGVLTVVARLLGLVRPDVAVFGEKDFQQLALIRRMVDDLAMGVAIEGAPIVRDADGLALSSRNAYLSPPERAAAPALHAALEGFRSDVRDGERGVAPLLERVRAAVAREPLLELQYADVVDPATLRSRERAEPGDRVLLAAFCGTTRLIDNVEVP